MSITQDFVTLISALTAIVTTLIAFLNYRNGARKDTVKLLQDETARAHQRLKQIEDERDEIDLERDRLRQRTDEQDSVIVGQESRINQLTKRLQEFEQLNQQDFKARQILDGHLDLLGRRVNELMLEKGEWALKKADLEAQVLQQRVLAETRAEEIERLHRLLAECEQRNAA